MSASKTRKWNIDKPHRCPECHEIAVLGDDPKSFKLYQCYVCDTRFARFPLLSRFMRPQKCASGHAGHYDTESEDQA